MKRNKFLSFLLCLTTIVSPTYIVSSEFTKSNNVISKKRSLNTQITKMDVPAGLIGAQQGTIKIQYTDPENCILVGTNNFLCKGDMNFNKGHFLYQGINFTITEIADDFIPCGWNKRHFIKTNLTIPGTIKKVGKNAFGKNARSSGVKDRNILSVAFEEGVEEIGEGSFKGCKDLEGTTIKLPNSIKHIGNDAFSGTKISELDLTNLDHAIDVDCNVLEEKGCLPKTLTRIYVKSERIKQKYAAYCHWAPCIGLIKVIDNPDVHNVIKVPANLFYGKQGYILVDDSISCNECKIVGAENFKASGLFNFNGGKIKIGGETLTMVEIADNAFNNKNNESYFENCDLVIPSTIKKVGKAAFKVYNTENVDCGINQVNFQEGVEYIGEEAFMNISFTNDNTLYLPSSIKYIGDRAFKDCMIDALNLDALGNNVLKLKNDINDYYNGILSRTIPSDPVKVYVKNCEALNNYVNDKFWYSYIANIYNSEKIGMSEKCIEVKTFNETFSSSTFPINEFTSNNEYFYIDDRIINRRDIVSVKFYGYKNCFHINDHFLTNCPNLETVDLSEITTLTTIGDFFLSGNYWLTKVILPNSIWKIGNSFLRECRSLSEFTFTANHPEDIDQFGDMFLAGNRSLKTVDLSNFKKFIKYKDGMLGWNNNLKKIYVDKDLYQQYINDENWGKIANLFEAK